MSGNKGGKAITNAYVTVVIPTFNRGEGLGVVLDALKRQTVPMVSVVVVDNSSTDNTAEILNELVDKEWGGQLRHIVREPNGPASARNTGLAAVATEFVLFLDSDVELAPDWIQSALEQMRVNPSMGAVGGKIIYNFDRSRVNAYGGDIGRFGLAWDLAEGAMRDDVNSAAQRIWINCSAMLARTEAIRSIGGFDEQFFYGYEDSDVGWKLNLAGFPVWVFPELCAFHHVDPAPGATHPDIVFHYCKNRLRSVVKNASPVTLIRMLAGYTVYTLVDLVLRAPRRAKLKALYWNISNASETLSLRRRIQVRRRVTDAAIFRLGEQQFLPPSPLGGLRRRHPVGVIVDVGTVSDGVNSDDRI